MEDRIRKEAAFISMVMGLAGWPVSVELTENAVRNVIASGVEDRIFGLVSKAKAEGRSYIEVAEEADRAERQRVVSR